MFMWIASFPNTPRPRPTSNLPDDKLSKSATSSANLRGFQKVAIAAANPMRIFFVRAARSEPSKIGLGMHSIVQLFVVCR